MKEILEQIDNWTLLKLVGGLTVILSSLISFTAYFIKDYFLNKWKANQEKELAGLKAQADQNNQLLNNVTNAISNLYLASNEKRIASLDKVWNGMMEIKRNLPALVSMAYTILTKEEIISLPQTNNNYTRANISSFKAQEYHESCNKIMKEIEKARPFIGENLWIVLFVYQAFLGRLTYLIEDGLKKGKVNYWKEDKNFIDQILGAVIKPDELQQLFKNDITSFHNVLNFLEFKALNDISEQISGKRMTEETVKQALELSKMGRNTID